MRRVHFVAAARAEFLAEVAYYDQAAPGRGARFAAAVEEATARALTFPLSGSPLEPDHHDGKVLTTLADAENALWSASALQGGGHRLALIGRHIAAGCGGTGRPARDAPKTSGTLRALTAGCHRRRQATDAAE